MIRDEFIKKIEDIGINLSEFGVYIDKIVKTQYSLGIFQDGQDWVVYNVDERNTLSESYRGEENIAFDRLFRKIFVRLDELNYVNDSITKEIIKVSKDEVLSFLKKTFEMEEWELEDTWNYLLQNFKVLNELKYYSVNKKYVPQKDAYHVEGYSAEDIFNETYLDELGALNYLIYLKRKPEKALADLKAGLPRK